MDLELESQFIIFSICYDTNIYFKKLLLDKYLLTIQTAVNKGRQLNILMFVNDKAICSIIIFFYTVTVLNCVIDKLHFCYFFQLVHIIFWIYFYIGYYEFDKFFNSKCIIHLSYIFNMLFLINKILIFWLYCYTFIILLVHKQILSQSLQIMCSFQNTSFSSVHLLFLFILSFASRGWRFVQ